MINLRNSQVMRYAAFLVLMFSTAIVQASVPLPDLVLYGRLHTTDGKLIGMAQQETTEVIVSVSNPSVQQPVQINSRFELFPSDEPNAGDIYVLRIPRRSGPTASPPFAAVSGDRLHIFVNGVEVRESVANLLMVAGTPSEVFEFNLNQPALPPRPGEEDEYTSWVAEWGLAGENAARFADPDGDRFPNYLEWYYKLDPTVTDGAEFVPKATIVSDDDGIRYFGVTYVRLIDREFLQDIVRVSFDLVTWDESEAEIELFGPAERLDEALETVTVRYARPIEDTLESLVVLQVDFREIGN